MLAWRVASFFRMKQISGSSEKARAKLAAKGSASAQVAARAVEPLSRAVWLVLMGRSSPLLGAVGKQGVAKPGAKQPALTRPRAEVR